MVDAYVAHAQYLRSQGDIEGALAAYKGAAECDPQNRTVRRTMEELTNLYDKEQALMDRASEAMARGRVGQAIGYWKDIQRLNPASRKATQQINQLSRQRSGGFSPEDRISSHPGRGRRRRLPVLYREEEALSQAETLVDKNEYSEAIELLKSTRILFFKEDAQRIMEDASLAYDEHMARLAGKLKISRSRSIVCAHWRLRTGPRIPPRLNSTSARR